MKFAKVIANIVAGIAAIYIMVFLFWIMLGMGCIQYVDQHGWSGNECGQDTMSQIIRVTHAPLIRIVGGRS